MANCINQLDPLLAAKIQWHISCATASFITSARFDIPDGSGLDPTAMFRSIEAMQLQALLLPPAASRILAKGKQLKLPQKQGGGREGKGRADDGSLGARINHDRQPEALKCERKFVLKVIKKHGLHDKSVPTLWCDEARKLAECCNCTFSGQCFENCERREAHKPVKENTSRFDACLSYKNECLARHRAAKQPNEPDFA